MKRISKFIVVFAFLIAALYLARKLLTDPIDSCLDLGGCWDYARRICRHSEPNAQDLCDGSNPNRGNRE